MVTTLEALSAPGMGGTKSRVFSGIQPSGTLHIGNYLGAIQRWVQTQDQYDNIFCIVDLHAITVAQEPKMLHAAIRELATIYLAAGIDPTKCAIFVQSHITAHAELAWLFNCVTPLGWMERMTQYKDKAGVQRERSSLGLLAYPTLMAADILLYHANGVPVGEDQKQHVELTRDIAERFNRLYAPIFTVPEPMIGEAGARIMGLDEPTKKMSKSAEGRYHGIALTDTPDVIRQKIKRATTDSIGTIESDPNRPGITNLLTIYQLFTGETAEALQAKYAGQGYVAFKNDLAEVVVEGLRPLREEYTRLNADPTEVERVLKNGADRVRPIADATLAAAKTAMGLG